MVFPTWERLWIQKARAGRPNCPFQGSAKRQEAGNECVSNPNFKPVEGVFCRFLGDFSRGLWSNGSGFGCGGRTESSGDERASTGIA